MGARLLLADADALVTGSNTFRLAHMHTCCNVWVRNQLASLITQALAGDAEEVVLDTVLMRTISSQVLSLRQLVSTLKKLSTKWS